VISQDLHLRSYGELLAVEKLITEPTVERFLNAGLPWGSQLEVGGIGGVAGLTPVPNRLRDE